MRRYPLQLTATAAALLLILAACEQGTTGPQQDVPHLGVGNGAPAGAHFNLNIIGVKLDKKEDFDANNENGIGHRIFVRLNHDDGSQNGKKFSDISKINKILLTPDDTDPQTFAVLDANATDSDGALFQLPVDVATEYQVWARPLGKPGGWSELNTCAVDPDTDEVFCSTQSSVFLRTKGKQSFENVSEELLTASIVVDPELNPDLAACLGVTEVSEVQVNLFDGCLQDYFWDYDNHGLKLLQLRFYPVGDA